MADINISELPAISTATTDDVFIINDGNATTSQITWSELQHSIQDLTGQVSFSQGTVTSPSITFTSDLNLGIYSPGPDEIAIATNGIQRLHIGFAGSVGIGNDNAASYNSIANNLVVGNTITNNGLSVVSGSTNTGNIYFADSTDPADNNLGQIVYDHSDNHLHLGTSGTERLRISSLGKVGIGVSDVKDILHVRSGDSGITATPTGQEGIIIEGGDTTSGGLQFYSAVDTEARITFGDSGSLTAGYIKYDHSVDQLIFQTNNAEHVVVGPDGNMAVGQLVGQTALAVSKDATGSASYAGVLSNSEVQSDVTIDYRYFRSTVGTQAASFTLADVYHFSATQGTIGTGSTVGTQYGFSVDSGLTGAGTNYGFHSNLPDATNNYGFYAAGSAKNYFNGTSFVVANGGVDALTVSDNIVSVSEGIVFVGGTFANRPVSPDAGLIRFNTSVSDWEGYNGTAWGSIGGAALVSTTPPANSNDGDLWYDADTGRSYVFYNDGDSYQWVEMNPSLNGGVGEGAVVTNAIVDGAVTPAKLDRAYLELNGGQMTGDLEVGGSVGNPNINLQTDGSATFTGTINGATVGTSDERFKENITPANSQLSDVVELGGILKNFDWNEDAPVNEDLRASRQLGLIAQEAEEICPSLVKTVKRTRRGVLLAEAKYDQEGNVTTQAVYGDVVETYKGISHDSLVMKLLGAIAEQAEQIETLEERLAALEERDS